MYLHTYENQCKIRNSIITYSYNDDLIAFIKNRNIIDIKKSFYTNDLKLIGAITNPLKVNVSDLYINIIDNGFIASIY